MRDLLARRDRPFPQLLDRHGQPAGDHRAELGALEPLAPPCLYARGAALRPHNDEVRFPIRWMSFSDDPVAPFDAVEALRSYYPDAPVERRHLAPVDLGAAAVGHFGFFRKSMARAARDDLAGWLGARLPVAAERADWAPARVGGNVRMSAPHVLAEVEDGIGWLTLNRPESLNALSFEMTDLLIKHTAEFEKDPKVRCVVIRGAGTHFMAGGDIKGFHKSLSENKAQHLAGFEMRVVKAHQSIYQIRRMQKPVLASVQGAAAGFGLSLILNCDLAMASDDAFFTLAYRHIGLSADGGATYFLPRIVGERKALEIALLGERFSAQDAKDNHILNWIVPKDQLAAETEKMARSLADGPTFALGVAKRLIRTSFDNSWDEHSHREAEGLAACAATEDHFEGLNAFLEKRKAAFKGR